MGLAIEASFVWCIMVVAPRKDMYCVSHIRDAWAPASQALQQEIIDMWMSGQQNKTGQQDETRQDRRGNNVKFSGGYAKNKPGNHVNNSGDH